MSLYSRLMAGRSGAAAIEVELREAAKSFNARELAGRVRAAPTPDEELAAALDAIASATPSIDRREGELFLSFGDPASDGATRRIDCSELCAPCGYGMEVHLHKQRVVGVSIYLE